MTHAMPLLKGEAAKEFLKSLELSHLRPYSDEKRERTDAAVMGIISKKEKIMGKYDRDPADNYGCAWRKTG